MTDPDPLRYSRQLALPQIGAAGQQRLAQSTVLIVGLGGLGAPASLYLANAGIGHLQLMDFDRVDASNLPRQILFQPEDIGAYKAEAAKMRLAQWNPRVKLSAQNTRLDTTVLTEALDNCDVVLDCSDNFSTRTAINTACAQTNTALVSGAAIRFEGQLAVFRHDLGGGPCYQCLYSEADETLENCAGQGILGPVAGMIGCMMATEAIKLILGIDSALRNQLWVYDGLAGNSRSIKIRQRANCPVCGDKN